MLRQRCNCITYYQNYAPGAKGLLNFNNPTGGNWVTENPRKGLFYVNRGRPVSPLALLYLLALEDFHQCRRNIGVVMHHIPFPLFTPVDVRHPPINTYPLVSELRLALFST
jgi:hypothetical protein